MTLKNTLSFTTAGVVSGVLISLHESIVSVFPFTNEFKFTGIFFGLTLCLPVLLYNRRISAMKFLYFIFFSGLGFFIAFLMFWILWSAHFHKLFWFFIPGLLGAFCLLIGFRKIVSLKIKEFLLILTLSGVIGMLFTNNFNPAPDESAAILFLKSPYSTLIIGWQTIIAACLGVIVDKKQANEKSLLDVPIVEQRN